MKKGKLGEERQSWGLPTRGLSSLGMWQGRGNLQAQAVSIPPLCHGCIASASGMEGTYYTFLEGMTAKRSSPAVPPEAGSIILAAAVTRSTLPWLP